MSNSQEILERIKNLSPAKRAKLAKWQKGELAANSKTTKIKKRQPGASIPLSFAQQRLWFLDQLVADSPAYNIAASVNLTGVLNVSAFEQTLYEIARRHEALRTFFEVRNGLPAQVIAEPEFSPLQIVDLEGLSEPERLEITKRLAQESAQRPFDLAKGPMLRLTLERFDARTHSLFFTMHHIISDRWSLSLYVQEVIRIYEAYCQGLPSPLPELAIQYPDFSIWQTEWLEGETLNAQVTFWKKQLENAPTVLDLPTDKPRPPVQTFQGSSESFYLPIDLASRLNAFSVHQGGTPFMAFFAAYSILLYRHTGQQDILIGFPIAYRNHLELEKMMGFFANTLVLRADLSGNPTYREFLARVRAVTLAALAHQDLPFEKLVDELKLDRDMSRNPLFQVMIAFQNTPVSSGNLPGLTITGIEMDAGTAKFDLWMSITEEERGLRINLEYSTDLFERVTAIRFLERFNVLLTALAENPDARLSDLPLLGPAEYRQLVYEWNDTSKEYRAEPCLHLMFESQAERTPDSIAVVFEHELISFDALNRKANQLARYLRKIGVGPEVAVGICVERSIEMVVGLLGILKAGGAYVPFDPSYPVERLAYILADSRVSVLLTQERLVDSLPGQCAHTLCIDSQWEAVRLESDSNPVNMSSPDNIAYVIYTSGSTGMPKGAMVPHIGIRNRLLWMQDQYNLTSDDRVLQKTPFSFDVSVWEFFWPLLCGAQLIVALPEGHKDAAYLVSLIRERQVTTLHFVPSMLRVFLEEPGLEELSSVKRVICSGEALPFDLQERFFSRSSAELHNLYGPTEASVDVTYWECQRESQSPIVPIGNPVSNTRMHLMDKWMNLCPTGCVGQLYIGGVQLGRGYLNKPDMTAERFIPNPHGAGAGDRLYVTGDLARRLNDGSIQYLRRSDHQVKLRGFRIELGEIESVLAQHPGVYGNVAVICEDIPGDKRLVNYLVPRLDYKSSADHSSPSAFQSKSVSDWRIVFDDAYEASSLEGDADFNILGWTSSYNGKPIPAEEMREWVDNTVRRILALQPERVLEIGCGTGLLLFRIAPHCQTYLGTDLSEQGLAYVRRALASSDLPQVSLLNAPADDFDRIEGGCFDTIILNSVAQYCPSLEYLVRILEGAVNRVRPGGSIFIGDIRSLALLEAFHISVEMSRADSEMTPDGLIKRVKKRIAQEGELIIDPAFFKALKFHLPSISDVKIQLKRGRHQNEMIRFRYDVILRIGGEPITEAPAPCVTWRRDASMLNGLEEILAEAQPDIFRVESIPNARVLVSGQILNDDSARDAIDPEQVWSLSEKLPYEFDITWSDEGSLGEYDVLAIRRDVLADHPLLSATTYTAAPDPNRPLNTYANNPLKEALKRELIPELQSYLKERLPVYMVPSGFVLMDSLPLLPNGKVDRDALQPWTPDVDVGDDYVAPTNYIESTLCDIWAQVLGLEQVGINDNFFELGGDSIHSIQVVFRARQAGFQIKTRQIFRHQTIAELAANITVEADAETDSASGTGSAILTPSQAALLESYASRPGESNQSFLFEASKDTPSDFPLARLSRDQIDHLLKPEWDVEDVYPCGALQEHMLLRYLAKPEPGLFVVQRINHSENTDPDVLRRVWEPFLDRHPILRTSFIWEGLDRPLQVVHKKSASGLEFRDWRGLSPTEQKAMIDDYMVEDRRRGIDLTTPAPIRILLARVTDAACEMVVTFNYMCLDGWSLGVAVDDLTRMYALAAAGQEPSIEPPRFTYRDHIAWLEKQDLKRAEQFWRQRLKGFERTTPLIEKAPGNAPNQEEGFDRQSSLLSEKATSDVRKLSRELHVTPNNFVQLVWAALLSKYTGEEDVLFGAVFTGRSAALPGMQSIVGSSMNILPMRVRLPRDMKLKSLLKSIRSQQEEMTDYEYSPLDRVCEWSEVPPGCPLFQTYMIFQNLETFPVNAYNPREVPTFVAQMEHPLRLDAFPRREMGFVASYHKRDFSAVAVKRMLKDFNSLMTAVVENPDQSVAELIGA
jgi:amino acid adenylation domain-containing protein